MSSSSRTTRSTQILNVFCSPQGEAWRVYVDPAFVPRMLRACLDEHGEAYPVDFDLQDLERYMEQRGVELEKRLSTLGCVELTARDVAAFELATWLSNMFASGVRQTRPGSTSGAQNVG